MFYTCEEDQFVFDIMADNQFLSPLDVLRAAAPRSSLRANLEDAPDFMTLMTSVLPEVWTQEYSQEDVKRYRAPEAVVSSIPSYEGLLKQNAASPALQKEIKHVQDMQRRLMDLVNHHFYVLALFEQLDSLPPDNEEAAADLDLRLKAAQVSQSGSLLITLAQSSALANDLARKAAGLGSKDKPAAYRLGDAVDARDLQEKFHRDLLAKAAPSDSGVARGGKGGYRNYRKNRNNKNSRRGYRGGRGGGRGFPSSTDPKAAGGQSK